MARVFLSYARDDAGLAKQLAGLIGEAGHQVWWDRDIQGGSHFSNEIDKALQDAEAETCGANAAAGERHAGELPIAAFPGRLVAARA